MSNSQTYEESQAYAIETSIMGKMIEAHAMAHCDQGWVVDSSKTQYGDTSFACTLICETLLNVPLEPAGFLSSIARNWSDSRGMPFPNQGNVPYRFEFEISGYAIGPQQTNVVTRISETSLPADGFAAPSQQEFLVNTVHNVHVVLTQALS